MHRSKSYVLSFMCLVTTLTHSHALEHGKSHADHHMQKHFNPEEWAQRFDDPAREKWQMPDRVIEALGLKQGQSVADIGAGTGFFTVRLAKSEASPSVYAVDIEPSMVQYLRERAAKEGLNNVIAVQASSDLPNLPEAVDLVLLVNTYHHIGDRPAYFQRLVKSLNPGGRVAIIDFRPDAPEGPPKEFRFPVEQFKVEMRKAGYFLTAQHDFLPWQEFLIFEVARRSTQ